MMDPDPESSFVRMRNRGDWRSSEPSGLGPENRVVAVAAPVGGLAAYPGTGAVDGEYVKNVRRAGS